MLWQFWQPRVADLDIQPVPAVPATCTVTEAVARLKAQEADLLLVTGDDGQVQGYLRTWDILTWLPQTTPNPWSNPVGSLPLKPVGTISLQESLQVERLDVHDHTPLVVTDTDGSPVGILKKQFVPHDLSTLYRRFYQHILDLLPVAVIAVRRDGKIVAHNSNAAKILGLPSDQVLGAQITDLIPHTGLPHVMQSGEQQPDARIVINQSVYRSSRSPIFHNHEVVGAVAILQDISDMEAANQKLDAVEEINRELNDIIDLSADGLVISDGQGILLRMNKAYEQIVGVKAEDFIGQHVNLLKEKGHLSDIVTSRVLQTGRQATICLEVRGREVLLTGKPIYNTAGELYRVVANIRDLTELNMLKEQVNTFKELSHRYLAELARLRAKEIQVDMIAESIPMRRVVELALRVAQVDSNVLITGESGTGKEVLAKLIHKTSPRQAGPFITINCGAIPPALLESELFGYEGGAFTGAKSGGKPGLLETAQGGTIFLDEIAEMSLDLQVKLLRVIQDRSFFKVGSNRPVNLDVRIIAATNRQLRAQVAQGQFREDLFYRLNVVQISIPPLRERKEDIHSLVMHFLHKFNRKYHFQKRITPQVMAQLCAYHWPGNVRELENTIERMVVLTQGDILDINLLFLHGSPSAGEAPAFPAGQNPGSLAEILAETERAVLVDTYERCRSTRQTARMLGISQPSVVRKLRKYGYQQVK